MKILFTVLITSFFIFSSVAQEPKDDDVEVITFGNDDDDRERKDYKYKDMIIKTSPTAFIFGKMPFEFEKELTDFLSVQAGLGLTFSSVTDAWGEALAELDSYDYCNSTQWNNDYCDNPYDYSYRSGKIGYMASISARLFWDQDGFDGGYIAPVIRYSTRRSDAQMIDESQNFEGARLIDSFDEESDKNLDLIVHYGAQYLNETITWEYFVGLGIRRQTRLLQDLGYDNNFNLKNGNLQEIKRNQILYEIGLRVGFRL